MERHGWGSNMRIVTNIRVVEKGMIAEKDGAQFDADLDTNEIVNADEPVAYDFTLTNSGTSNLIHPTFTDSDIGVTISWDQGLVVKDGANQVTVFDKNGGALDASDLVITYTNPKNGNTTVKRFADNEELIRYLTDELVIETEENTTPPCGVLTVSGIYYRLTAADIQAGGFRNQVTVTAYMRNDSTSTAASNAAVGDPVTIQQTISQDITDTAPVKNDFVFTNSGDTNQIHPTFRDSDGGISISPESGLQVSTDSPAVDQDGGTLDITDLVFIYKDPDGGVTERTFTSNEELQEYLKNKLVVEPGGTLTVEGIYYTPTDDQVTDGKYENTVDVTTYQRDDTNSVPPANTPTNNAPLQDEADFTVYVPTRPLYYHWRDNALMISKDVLAADVSAAANDADTPLSNLVEHTITAINTVALSGNQVIELQPGELTLDADGNITADFQTTGVKLIYLDIAYTYTFGGVYKTATATIPVQIFVLDVQSYTYVLDYGLRVELTYRELFNEDTYTVAGRETVFEMLGITNEANVPSYGNNSVNGFNALTGNGNLAWGIFAQDTDYQGNININAAGTAAGYAVLDPAADANKDSVFMTYTPKEFMDQRDTIYIAFRVREAGYTDAAVLGNTGSTNIQNEAVMFKKITFLPANVVYYEDDFAAVIYQTDKDTFAPTSEHNQAQASDQSEQYGHDQVYAGSTDVTMSGGTIAEITLSGSQTTTLEAAAFTFKGTGFEMISRTNAADSAIIQVAVTGVFETGGASQTRYYPIITEFDQITTTGTDQTPETDEVYQVPVFRLTDLPYGTFSVTISGIPTYEFDSDFNPYVKPTKLYIDGIRIYNPLEDPTADEYGAELGAVFTELRTLVFDSKAAAIGLTMGEDGTPSLSGTFGQHWSFTENLNEGWFSATSGNLQQFAIAGPNNEVYMGAAGSNAVVLFVKETTANTAGLLQIGVHDLDESDFEGGTETNGASSIRYWTSDGWVNITVGTSGTEQYYPVDYRSCPKVDGDSDYYYVVIQVNSGMVSFTNVKTVGLEFGTLTKTEENVRYKYEDGVLLQAPLNEDTWTEVSCPLVTQLLRMKSVLRENTNAGQPDEEQPGGGNTGSDAPIEENPKTGETDLLWAAVCVGLFGLAAIVPMIRKEVRV